MPLRLEKAPSKLLEYPRIETHRGGIDGHSARVGGRVGLLASVQLEGLKVLRVASHRECGVGGLDEEVYWFLLWNQGYCWREEMDRKKRRRRGEGRGKKSKFGWGGTSS